MRSKLLTSLAAVAILAAGCATTAAPVAPDDVLRDDAVTIGSFNFPESVLLAELYAQTLEANGFRVERELELGPRELVEPALEKGLIELVPEYAGSLLAFAAGGPTPPSRTETLEELRVELARRGLVPLASAFAQNQNGFAVTEIFARELDVHALSDLEGHGGLVLGGPPECQHRPLCQPGLQQAYGIRFEAFVPLDQSGPLTTDALARGLVDVALMFTTSAEIIRHRFVLLADDRHLQPAEHITPIVRADTLDRFGPKLATWIDAVSTALTTQELRAMNAQVEIFGRSPSAVAREWLEGEGLLPGEG
jgi:osmoprotectant transport system substrate-binding protein